MGCRSCARSRSPGGASGATQHGGWQRRRRPRRRERWWLRVRVRCACRSPLSGCWLRVAQPDDTPMTSRFISPSYAVGQNRSMRVLIVEDEARMADVIRRALTRDGVAADVAGDGGQALELATIVDYDAVVLDVMLPDRSGFEVCRLMRDRGVWSPVLMLTALDAVHDRVAGLDSGADDYLVKPFALAELQARLRALARRGRPERPAVLEVGEVRLDPALRAGWRGDPGIELSVKEFALLEALMRRPGEVLSRLELIESAWDIAYENRSNVVDVYMGRLRRKIDDGLGTAAIETVRGAGYRMRDG